MPPGESIRELAIQALEAKFAEIVAGDDFHTTVRKIVRYEEWDDALIEYPAIMVTSLDAAENDTEFLNRQVVNMRFRAVGVLETWENQRRDSSRFIDDMKKAVLRDATLGGVSGIMDTRVTGSAPFLTDEDRPRAGGVIEGLVKFRHIFQDSFTPG